MRALRLAAAGLRYRLSDVDSERSQVPVTALLVLGATELTARRGPAATRLSRRGTVPRTVALVTIAVALLCYGAVVWDAAGRDRTAAAGAELGAATVYTVHAPSVAALRTDVEAADPSGHDAMAVARGVYGTGADTTEVLAVDSARLPAVAFWRSSFASGSAPA